MNGLIEQQCFRCLRLRPVVGFDLPRRSWGGTVAWLCFPHSCLQPYVHVWLVDFQGGGFEVQKAVHPLLGWSALPVGPSPLGRGMGVYAQGAVLVLKGAAEGDPVCGLPSSFLPSPFAFFIVLERRPGPWEGGRGREKGKPLQASLEADRVFCARPCSLGSDFWGV